MVAHLGLVLSAVVLRAPGSTPSDAVVLRWAPSAATVQRYSLDFQTSNTTELDAGEDRWKVAFSAGLQATEAPGPRYVLRSYPSTPKLSGLYGRTFDRSVIWRNGAWPFRIEPTGLIPAREFSAGGALLIFGSVGALPGFNVVFPTQPVRVGDTWEPSVPGQPNTYVLARLTHFQNDIATIEWNGTAAFDEPVPEAMEGRFSLTRYVKFRQSSRHRVSDGTVLSAQVKATMRTEQLALTLPTSPVDDQADGDEPTKPPEAETVSRGTVGVSVRLR
ncbi:MAG: hypothetical protein SFX74_04445 [Fimbriimonadaceae bacterium]|nr:hypothetical protein [Fimbriimonadaceae bacterium]